MSIVPAVVEVGARGFRGARGDGANVDLGYFGVRYVEDGVTADQSTRFLDALNSGRVLTGNGKTVNVAGSQVASEAFGGLRHTKLVQLTPTLAGVATLNIKSLNDWFLDNVFVDAGSAFTTAGSGQCGIKIEGGQDATESCKRFSLRRIRVKNLGPCLTGAGLRVEGSDFHVDDVMTWGFAWDLTGITNDIINSVYFDECEDFEASRLSMFDVAGTNGGVATDRYTRGLAMGGCHGFQISRIFARGVDQGLDLTGSNGNTEFTIDQAKTKETGSYGLKFANTAKNGLISNCMAELSGICCFIINSSAAPETADEDQAQNLFFEHCLAKNPGGSAVAAGWHGYIVQPGGGGAPGYPRGIVFDDCHAIDDRGAGALMKSGFDDQITPPTIGDGTRPLNICRPNCTVFGNTQEPFRNSFQSLLIQTVASNAINITGWPTDKMVRVSGGGIAATLRTITDDRNEGDVIHLARGGDVITVEHGIGNIFLAGGFDKIMTATTSVLTLRKRSTSWIEPGWTDNGQGQYRFPATQNPSTDPNTLDDYEEGTWTPALTAVSTPPTGVTYGVQEGDYRKVGSVVELWGHIGLTSKGTLGVGQIKITGLTFVAAKSVPGMGFRHQATNIATPVSILTSANTLLLEASQTGTAVPWSALTDTSDLIFATTFHV